jgi:hypothetical protein
MSGLLAKHLTNDEFIALRALGREPWRVGTSLWWRHYGTWCRLSPDGRMDGENGRVWHGRQELSDRAQEAVFELAGKGLVVETIDSTCCPNPQCPRNVILQLTERGRRLLAAVSPPKPVVASPAPPIPTAWQRVTRSLVARFTPAAKESPADLLRKWSTRTR